MEVTLFKPSVIFNEMSPSLLIIVKIDLSELKIFILSFLIIAAIIFLIRQVIRKKESKKNLEWYDRTEN